MSVYTLAGYTACGGSPMADVAWWQTLLSGSVGGLTVVVVSSALGDIRDRTRDRLADQRRIRDATHERLLAIFRRVVPAAAALEDALVDAYNGLEGEERPKMDTAQATLVELVSALQPAELEASDELADVLDRLSRMRQAIYLSELLITRSWIWTERRCDFIRKQLDAALTLCREIRTSSYSHVERYRQPI